MLPEFASLVMLFGGLHGSTDVAETAAALVRFDQAVNSAKTIRVEFNQTETDAIEKAETKRTGEFLLRREGDKTAWRLQLKRDGSSEEADGYGWADSQFSVMNGQAKSIRVFRIDDKNKQGFESAWVTSGLPLASLEYSTAKYDIRFAKRDHWYSYMFLNPKSTARVDGWFIGRTVLMNRDGETLRKDMVRRFERLLSNGNTVCMDFTRWAIDDPKDEKNLLINADSVPEGWTVSRVDGVPTIWNWVPMVEVKPWK